MKIITTPLAGVFVVETTPFIDKRGAFFRAFCDNELLGILGNRKIEQINHSRTHAMGAVRGLHYQTPPYAEMKLVRCLKGKVWDVAVDLRSGSATFLKWHAVELSAENARMLVIPEGCAHGFQVLTQDSELLYLHTNKYMPQSEGGVRYNDPALNIQWPCPITDLSSRDESHQRIGDEFTGISF